MSLPIKRTGDIFFKKGGKTIYVDTEKGSGSSKKSGKKVDKVSKGGIIKDEISALGANKFEQGFSEENLDRHWGGISDHSSEYKGFTREQYAQRALELVQSAADGKNILGYKLSDGTVVRYDVKTFDFVKGHPKYGIYTMFKPNNKSAYFHQKKKDEGGITK